MSFYFTKNIVVLEFGHARTVAVNRKIICIASKFKVRTFMYLFIAISEHTLLYIIT